VYPPCSLTLHTHNTHALALIGGSRRRGSRRLPRYSIVERRAVRAEGLLCFLNRSQCSLKQGLLKAARRDADHALGIDPGERTCPAGGCSRGG